MMISIRQAVGIRQRMPVSQDNPGGSNAGQSMGGVAHKVGRRAGQLPPPPPLSCLNVGFNVDKKNTERTSLYSNISHWGGVLC